MNFMGSVQLEPLGKRAFMDGVDAVLRMKLELIKRACVPAQPDTGPFVLRPQHKAKLKPAPILRDISGKAVRLVPIQGSNQSGIGEDVIVFHSQDDRSLTTPILDPNAAPNIKFDDDISFDDIAFAPLQDSSLR